ncbi:PREDICTED: uncharacterized protein LOC104602155 isoform X2 [Nelumbo nucifera]|uniref:Uncharacterized protein LOC104602155 isoform X2 n=1 Tax=Nelumbo nucifera TaxID=4432 RepID=A0A1U8AB86_NELNU|nr:PREDICTED: uncharacterized protein LOC104602155 isoform X2 [Nelumbo nucifera]
MARSAFDASILDSTSRLLTLLDLNEEDHRKKQNMEDLDVDQIIDVPDNPDRMTTRKNGEKNIGSSVAGNSVNADSLRKYVPNLLRGRGKLITENGNSSRSYPRSQKELTFTDKTEHGISSIFPFSDNATVSKKSHFRTMMPRQTTKLEIKSSAQPQHSVHVPCSSHGRGDSDCLADRTKLGGRSGIPEVFVSDVRIQDGSRGKLIDLISNDKSPSYSTNPRNTRRKMLSGDMNFDNGKVVSTGTPRLFSCIPENHVLDLTVQNEFSAIPEREGNESKYLAEKVRKGSIAANGCPSTHVVRTSSRASSSAYKGKTKLDDNTCDDDGAGLDFIEAIDLSNDSESKTKQKMHISPHSTSSPRKIGQKRLVRNGCISPYNIAKAKHTAESLGKSSRGAKQNDFTETVSSSGTSSSEIQIISPNSEGNHTARMKGKGVLNDQIPAKGNDGKALHFQRRSSINLVEEASRGSGGTNGDVSQSFEERSVWRSTQNPLRKLSSVMFDEVGHLPGDDKRHGNRMENINYVNAVNNSPQITNSVEVRNPATMQHGATQHLSQASSSIIFKSDKVNRKLNGENKLMKRQKKHGPHGSNTGDCSTSTFDDSEVAYLCSSGEPPNARTTRTRNPCCRGASGPIIEIDDISPEIRCSNSQDASRAVIDDSDSRARQVEADEILAHQLQEQFYNELPGAAFGEIDAGIVRTLQQEEDTHFSSFRGSRHSSHHYPARSFQNSSIRSSNRGRVSTSARMARPRASFLGQSPIISSRERTIEFPSTMDFETRIHILEALEARVGNSNDVGMAAHFFQVQRDFNENDYEMLLALDENNHQHRGASLSQINGLPHSIVQTDNFEEVCAVCLETPTIGDTIRHLPCLHKFHKDCVDPWLRRRTSCPVCKSSIT